MEEIIERNEIRARIWAGAYCSQCRLYGVEYVLVNEVYPVCFECFDLLSLGVGTDEKKCETVNWLREGF